MKGVPEPRPSFLDLRNAPTLAAPPPLDAVLRTLTSGKVLNGTPGGTPVPSISSPRSPPPPPTTDSPSLSDIVLVPLTREQRKELKKRKKAERKAAKLRRCQTKVDTEERGRVLVVSTVVPSAAPLGGGLEDKPVKTTITKLQEEEGSGDDEAKQEMGSSSSSSSNAGRDLLSLRLGPRSDTRCGFRGALRFAWTVQSLHAYPSINVHLTTLSLHVFFSQSVNGRY